VQEVQGQPACRFRRFHELVQRQGRHHVLVGAAATPLEPAQIVVQHDDAGPIERRDVGRTPFRVDVIADPVQQPKLAQDRILQRQPERRVDSGGHPIKRRRLQASQTACRGL
jgi:hypothetical protein